MNSYGAILIVILSSAAGFTLRGDASRTRRDAPYRGPPAPLNHDGTVAFTPEFQQLNDIHNAAHAEEYQRLQAAAALAAALPDRTSKDYNTQDNGQYSHQDDRQIGNLQEDDGQYRPHLYEREEGSNQQYISSHQQVPFSQGRAQQYYNPTPYTPAAHHSQQQYAQAAPNPQSHVPAPLNLDGTVAHTPEYLALAASLHKSYQQHPQARHRRSLNLYHGPPAPLNHDGTVANTPDVEQAIAVHKAAYTQALQNAANQQDESRQEDDGQYKAHLYNNEDFNLYEGGQYNHHDQYLHKQEPPHTPNPSAHIPAPLNHDGTVAHTAEYKAIAAAHQAELRKSLHTAHHQSNPLTTSLSPSFW